MNWNDIKELAIKRKVTLTQKGERYLLQFPSNFALWMFIDDIEKEIKDLKLFVINHSTNQVTIIP